MWETLCSALRIFRISNEKLLNGFKFSNSKETTKDLYSIIILISGSASTVYMFDN